MISIDFLRKPVSGLEFIDFQTTHFYDELAAVYEKHITTTKDGYILETSCVKEVLATIERFTGFANITMKFIDSGNLGVDTGYFSPHHVLNNAGVDDLLGVTKTTLYRWFVQNKVKMFKGDIDYTTGMVTGSFTTVPVNLQINRNLHITFPKDKVEKYKVSIGGLLAGATAHELGHVFGGCMMLATAASDNVVAKAGLRFYKEAPRPEDRVVVLKDTAALLDITAPQLKEMQAIAQSGDDTTFVLYFTKLQNQRNSRRSLSVGVERMSSEVIADMYAIRMGCSKGIIGAISALTDIGAIRSVCTSLLTATMLTVFISMATAGALTVVTLSGGAAGAIAYVATIFTVTFVYDYFSKGYANIYNSDARRYDDAMRQMIAKLKEEKNVTPADKAELISYIDQMRAHGKTIQPWYDDSVIYRFMGWVLNGSDFKLTEIEHYTQVIANHELNSLGAKLASLLPSKA